MQDFKKALIPVHLRTMQIIHIAMPLGVVFLFGLVVLFHTRNSAGASSQKVSLIKLLSFFHAAVAVIVYKISRPLFDRTLLKCSRPGYRCGTSPVSETQPDPALQIVRAILSAQLIRLALFDAVAVFGLIICLSAAIVGVLQQYPVYWLNTLSSLFLVWFVSARFPTEERLEDLFRKKILHFRPRAGESG